jgi:hypothetical protein
VSSRTAWETTLRDLGSSLRLTHQTPLGQKGLGVIYADRELWRIGGEWLAAHRAPRSDDGDSDVYVATNIYKGGGHTALIGDFVRALSTDGAVGGPKLIISNTSGHSSAAIDEDAQARSGILASNTVRLRGPSLVDRLDQLFETLRQLKPRRLFLFHHPDDPVPAAAARPEIARQRVLVHHADGRLAFGLHLPGMCLIDLNPIAAATSRIQGLVPALLRLTAPDPGPRPDGFLRRQQLVTATCAPFSKISQPHFYSYAETVGTVLRATSGWHVHIGELDRGTLEGIHAAVTRSGAPKDRFVHIPWTPSLTTTLWEQACDVYLGSYPIDGARTNVEVMASGTPHLRFAPRHSSSGFSEIAAAGGLAWQTWEELELILRQLADPQVLAERSRLIRAAYESLHHPGVFAACLQQILSGGEGADDPHRQELDQRALRSLTHATAATVLKLSQRAEGNSARARLLRWLLRS